MKFWLSSKKEDRHCYNCGIEQAKKWFHHSEPGQYLCQSCYDRERNRKKKIKF
uniref:Uncharacterized protein n=1 Tax=Meloidogyne enterolobii TaxID=390850 RepID=A0A6V7XJW0_MELEN|nr:unnamed protein product [Meloidogyne enterolobii]